MSPSRSAVRRTPEPVRAPTPELPRSASPLVRRLGRVRLPLALGHRPWATAYRLPSGATVWCVRLWQDGRVVRSVVTTTTLRRYARRSGLTHVLAEIDAIVGPEERRCPPIA
jgi:hypothetical protein